ARGEQLRPREDSPTEQSRAVAGLSGRRPCDRCSRLFSLVTPWALARRSRLRGAGRRESDSRVIGKHHTSSTESRSEERRVGKVWRTGRRRYQGREKTPERQRVGRGG